MFEKERRPEHYAANGRTVTACGLTCQPNVPNGKFNNDNPDPKCAKCRAVLKLAYEEMDPESLAICSEDDKGLNKAKEALRNAETLAHDLGPAWKPHVWENLGWHWSARAGGMKVHPFIFQGTVKSYTAFLGDPDTSGGRWAESGQTPRESVRNVLKRAKAEMDGTIALVLSAAQAGYEG